MQESSNTKWFDYFIGQLPDLRQRIVIKKTLLADVKVKTLACRWNISSARVIAIRKQALKNLERMIKENNNLLKIPYIETQ